MITIMPYHYQSSMTDIELYEDKPLVNRPDNELKAVLDKKLEARGLTDLNDFIAEQLIDVVINAKSPDIHGDLHKDYWEVNRALATLHKIANPKVGQSNINIWLFAPQSWPLKY